MRVELRGGFRSHGKLTNGSQEPSGNASDLMLQHVPWPVTHCRAGTDMLRCSGAAVARRELHGGPGDGGPRPRGGPLGPGGGPTQLPSDMHVSTRLRVSSLMLRKRNDDHPGCHLYVRTPCAETAHQSICVCVCGLLQR